MLLPRAIALTLCLLVAGCREGLQSHSDEQKDPYYLAGKNRLQERDYLGAIDMFEKALDVNPRSGSAHFELGVLYEQQQSDFAAALYHYQRAVMMNSNLPSADLSRQRILECKRELAKTVVQPLSMEHLQRDLDAARAENQQLKQQVKAWQDYFSSRGGAAPSAPLAVEAPSAPRTTLTNPARSNAPAPARPNSSGSPASGPVAGSSRTHKVAAGESMTTIARKYGIKVSALQAANPSVDSRRMRQGLTLVIPPS